MAEKREKLQTISELDDQSQDQPSSGAAVSPSMEELQAALGVRTEELQALQDKYLRLAAEFDNYKKLSQRERSETSKFANENILRDLLPIIDNLERAIKAAKNAPSGDGLVRGVELTLKQFTEVLAKFGVQAVPSIGTPFDPTRHQAVARVETSDLPENHVIEEFQKGYLLHDRILRPAMVSVATTPAGSQRSATAKADADFA